MIHIQVIEDQTDASKVRIYFKVYEDTGIWRTAEEFEVDPNNPIDRQWVKRKAQKYMRKASPMLLYTPGMRVLSADTLIEDVISDESNESNSVYLVPKISVSMTEARTKRQQ